MANVLDTSTGWHLKKEIQLSHLITTITVAISALFYVTKLEQRIAVIEAQMADQRQVMTDAVTRIQSSLDKLDSKFDRLLETRNK